MSKGTVRELIKKNPNGPPEGSYDPDELKEIKTSTDKEDTRSTAEKLYQVSEATNDDGTVDVEITDWDEKTNDRGTPMGILYVEFWTVTEGTKRETMDFPERDDSSYKFVRLLNDMGLSLRAAMMEVSKDEEGGDMLVGETVKADPDTWELQAPESKATTQRLREHTVGSYRFRRAVRLLNQFTFHISAAMFIVSAVFLLVMGGEFLGLVATASFCGFLISAVYAVASGS